jgi:chemotaxis methyl-accepting protein methylase
MQESSLPDLDTYDKLMHYQTTLNNQLSKQISELMELEKLTLNSTKFFRENDGQ